MTSDRKGSMGRATRFAIGLLLYAVAVPVHAATITVTNTNDSGPGSLRQALTIANDGDTIGFAVTGTISLTSGELVIDKNIIISGPGPGLLTVARSQQAADFRIFNIPPSHTAEIDGLTITGGSLVGNEIGRAHAELQSPMYLVCRLLLEKKKTTKPSTHQSSNTNILFFLHDTPPL